MMNLFSSAHQTVQDPMERPETCLLVCKTLFTGRRYKEALAMLEHAVARHPCNVELLHLRGLCLQANNNAPAAFATFMSVLNINPKHVASLCSVGCMYKARGMLQEAVVAYQQALEAADASAAAEITSALAALYTDMGSRAKAAGNGQDALVCYQRALELCPAYAPTHYHMGVLYSEAKQMDEALGWYQQAVRCCPSYAEAHCNIGVICKDRGDLEAAISSYERALESAPNFAIVKSNMAIALTDLGTRVKLAGRLAEGIALYERALAYNPRYADALYNLGVAHGESGNVDRAIFMYETAVQCNPACAEAYNNMGVIYKERDNLERAMECYTTALTVKPNFPQSLNNMGVIFTCQGRAQEALTLLTAAIASCPTYAEAHNNLGVLQRDVGAVPQALASYTRCLELAPDSRNAGQNRLLALNYIRCGNEEEVCRAHAEWGQRFASLFQPLPHLGPADRDLSLNRPLRVGYISPDLFTHSVSYFAEAPLTFHNTPFRRQEAAASADVAAPLAVPAILSKAANAGSLQEERSNGVSNGHVVAWKQGGADKAESHAVQHVVYCCAPKRDGKTARLKANVLAAHGLWHEVTQLSEADLAALVREDQIDILVELTGHTANNRLGTLAMRPAPIQVTWIGYPNSTGLQAIDYRITDDYADAPDTKQTFVEELVRMPGGSFLCYTPAPDAPAVAPAPALTAGFVTFGSFNNLAKITPEVLTVWARILKAVPGSRLVLKNKPFACETARMHVLNLLAAQGVESWRVDLLPLAAANSEHLATYALMDISLDTFPYAGTTTTCESMYMGVPCLTLAGQGHAHNVGVSLVTSLGMQKDWVAHSPDEYVSMAVAHATDVPRLAALRQKLRQRMTGSRLCDAPNFVRELEQVYRDMWVKHVTHVLEEKTEGAGQAAGGDAAVAVKLGQQGKCNGHAAQQAEMGPCGRRWDRADAQALAPQGAEPEPDATMPDSQGAPVKGLAEGNSRQHQGNGVKGNSACAGAALGGKATGAAVNGKQGVSRPCSPGTPGLSEEEMNNCRMGMASSEASREPTPYA